MTTSSAEMPKKTGETMPSFLPTPDRVSQFLELKRDVVVEKMKSIEGRKALMEQLLEHEEELKKIHPDFDPEELHTNLEAVGETLQEKERFLKATVEPEKKGFFRRAFDRVKGFAKKHPFVTAVGVTALAAAAVAAGFYMAGEWELLMTSTGLSRVFSGAEAAGELLPPTAPTAPLPGGGTFEIPPPASPPDLGIPT